MKGRSKQAIQARPQAVTPKDQCHHYWVIEVANGPESRGTCKYCGVKKEFLNAFPEYNPLKKPANPLDLPKMPRVKMEEDNKSLNGVK